MPDRLITLEEVERLLSERSSRRIFSPRLADRFEQATSVRRAKLLRGSALRTAILYNVFLLGDLFLTPDTLRLAIVLHLAVVTPYILFVAWIVPQIRSARVREIIATTIAVAMTLQILAVFCTTRSPYAAHYLYFVPSTVLSLSSAQRWRAGQAYLVAALSFVLLLAALAYRNDLPIEIVAMQSMIYVICVLISLNSNLVIEGEERWHFLTTLRERLHAEESDDDANHDPLTGLGNRRFLDKKAADLWSVGAAVDRSVAAIVFDVDCFKTFNDRYGHARGDSCLKRVAACAAAEMRSVGDLAFRTGGEEFLVLLPQTELEPAIGVAERIRMAIQNLGIPHEDNACADVVTASFGVSAAQVGNCSLDALIETADGALYAAKHDGRNRTRALAPKLAGEGADRAA